MAVRGRRKPKKNYQRSGFLVMFIILVILGSFVYFYRDRFMVLFDTGISSGKDVIAKKIPKKESKNNKAFELIDMIEGITGKSSKSEKNKQTVSNNKVNSLNKVENKPVDILAINNQLTKIIGENLFSLIKNNEIIEKEQIELFHYF